MGEPAGIGPDVVLTSAQKCRKDAELILIADRDMLRSRASTLGLTIELIEYEASRFQPSGEGVVTVLHEALTHPVNPGEPDTRNADDVLRALRRGAHGCLSGEFDALVTAPINKAVISDSGTPFLGHTEYLADLTGCSKVVMLLAAQSLRVALATTHLPLSRVSAAINEDDLLQTLRILNNDLRNKFGIDSPRISVLGLNPHAGEDGHLGNEEIETIIPAMRRAQDEGILAMGPWPADTAFNAGLMEDTDAYLAMYHDQGLPVLKYASFGAAVNITLGLPIVRCSVDHGTAFDIAGSGRADESGFDSAVAQALILSRAPR